MASEEPHSVRFRAPDASAGKSFIVCFFYKMFNNYCIFSHASPVSFSFYQGEVAEVHVGKTVNKACVFLLCVDCEFCHSVSSIIKVRASISCLSYSVELDSTRVSITACIALFHAARADGNGRTATKTM